MPMDKLIIADIVVRALGTSGDADDDTACSDAMMSPMSSEARNNTKRDEISQKRKRKKPLAGFQFFSKPSGGHTSSCPSADIVDQIQLYDLSSIIKHLCHLMHCVALLHALLIDNLDDLFGHGFACLPYMF
jgi:hypothetical protein